MPDRGEPGSLSEIFTRDFLLLATINLAMFFGFQMTNVGLPVYVAQLGANAQTVGLIGTVMTITAVTVRIFAGPLLDRFGRKGALVSGAIIMATSIVSYAVFPFVGVILGVRLLQGVGWGLGSTAASTIAADVIPKRRFAEGMGYFAMTNALSSALAPAVSIELVQGAGGQYMIYVAFGCTVLAFILALFQRNAGRKRAASMDSPTTSAPDTTRAPSPDNAPAEPAIAASEAHAVREASPASPPASTASVFIATVFERRALFPGMLMLLVNIGFGCITTFIALHGQEQGIDNVSVYFIAYAVVTLASRPLTGRLIDRYGYRMPSILSCAGTVLTLVLIGLSSNAPMFACAGALAGLGIGTAMGVYQAMAVASVEPWRRGVATSTYFIMFDVGIALGSFFGGMVAGALGYTAMYIIVAAFPLIAGALSVALIGKPPATTA